MSDSTMLTIGTALYRAWDTQQEIDVLVNQAGWLTGTVVGVDGHGVVFKEQGQTHMVLRLEAVLGVRIETSATVPEQHEPPELRLAVTAS
jgi:hypothetical protein